ncbi:hypothetical protein [Acinetobacter radioresistens]|uniref:hypothetical protein n=1 Tax=Acinetobacter radioresistens TaxID=40216 RepID=UPI001D177242|nr:hypothetical protein [Acinetobacter radioresistens]
MGLEYLWYASDDELTKFYPELMLGYDADTAFFKALEILLKSGDKYLFYNLNSKEPSKDGEHLSILIKTFSHHRTQNPYAGIALNV